MAYSENGGVINTDVNVTAGGYVTKKYLFEAYPQLSDQAKSAGLWNWGKNQYGQLGDNLALNKSSPIQTVAGGANWKLVTCGAYTTVAIKTDGTLWTWGQNNWGMLGDNTTVSKPSPVQTITGGTNWQLVDSSHYHVAAIKTDGTLWLWGRNQYGELGINTNGSSSHKSSPVQTIASGTNWKLVSCAQYYTAAIKTDGTMWLWGYNGYGNLGNNNTDGKSSPVQTIAGGTNWKFLSCGGYHTTAIKTDGTLWTWGLNAFGQLGNNSITHQSSPIQTISSGTNWKQVACGWKFTTAIKTDGTLWSWGHNNNGQLGDGTTGSGTLNNNTNSKSSPVQTVAGGTNWKLVACANYLSTTAIKTDGTLWTWGQNDTGQLGDSTIVGRSSPVQTVAGGTNWKSVAMGRRQTVAIKDFNEDF
jgi:alpha-tubulin suppressor-like RCC1 family protein